MPENEINSLNVSFERLDNNILLAKLEGKMIDQTTSNELTNTIISEITSERKQLILDLSRVDYLNSSGLNSIISILTKTRTKGGEMVVLGINEKVKKLLIITKLSSVITTTESLEEAKNQFKQINQN